MKAKYEDAAALRDVAVDLTIFEVMANTTDIAISAKFNFEIDCPGKRMKLLENFISNNNDLVQSSPVRGKEYEFVAPDSNGEWIWMLVCPRP